jgi:processive 1,2-diacylglycerol beta-glucosyltransferase/1,2-diacylglycerol 3-beta-galactosyltransferase
VAPARAVAAALKESQPDIVDTVLVDGLAEAPRIIRWLVEDGYRFLQAHARWYYALIYFINKFRPVAWLNEGFFSWCVKPYLERVIALHRPDKTVIFHFLLIRPVKHLRRRGRCCPNTLVVVTDPFTAHPSWFRDKSRHVIVFSERLRRYALGLGVRPERIAVFPFIIDDKFKVTPASDPPEKIKLSLGFDPLKKLLLIVGGGDGIPKGGGIVRHLLRHNPTYHIVVVCGKNELLKRELIGVKQKSPAAQLTVLGYVDNIHQLLHAADLVITKCGASMCMEILQSKKIAIVSSYLWEQEKGNMEFLIERGMGIYERRPSVIPSLVDRLFSEPNLVNRMKANIASARISNGTPAVADYILGFSPAAA